MNYKHYISLGYFCSIAIELEKMGLRNESSPFDWVISDFQGVVLAVEEEFSDFLNYDILFQNKKNLAVYKNVKYNISFFHDFDKYSSLEKQLSKIQEKYKRRINRFYKSITEPTLFIRYISDEELIKEGNRTISKELYWIENNYEKIISLIKSFNANNDILFIANENVRSSRFVIYNVKKDSNDVVNRSPINNNSYLKEKFDNIDFKDKEKNIRRYQKKMKCSNSIYNRIRDKIKTIYKEQFLKEYSHEKQF